MPTASAIRKSCGWLRYRAATRRKKRTPRCARTTASWPASRGLFWKDCPSIKTMPNSTPRWMRPFTTSTRRRLPEPSGTRSLITPLARDNPMTQLEAARQGVITPEMACVASLEDLDAELVRSEVERGRMVIPANVRHLEKRLEPMGIGIAARCKINANIGNSAVTGTPEIELEKLHTAVHLGADTVMDLSTGGNIDGIRQAIIDDSPVPIGTVPMYQVEQLVKDPADLTPQMLLDMVEHQARQGVDYMTIHAGVLLEYVSLTANRVTGIVSRGGSLIAAWMIKHHQQNPWYTHFDELCE